MSHTRIFQRSAPTWARAKGNQLRSIRSSLQPEAACGAQPQASTERVRIAPEGLGLERHGLHRSFRLCRGEVKRTPGRCRAASGCDFFECL